MDAHAQAIWSGSKSRKKILEEARFRFRRDVKTSPVAAHVSMASVRYSLVKRSWPWMPHLALFDMRRAVVHSNRGLGNARYLDSMTADQLDVVSTVWRRAPWWLGGSTALARRAIEAALKPDYFEVGRMKPHTRALLLISLVDILWREKKHGEAWRRLEEAKQLVPAIKEEDSPDREHQLVRVYKHIGFFERDHTEVDSIAWNLSLMYLRGGLDLARRIGARGQELDIIAGIKKRKLPIAV